MSGVVKYGIDGVITKNFQRQEGRYLFTLATNGKAPISRPNLIRFCENRRLRIVSNHVDFGRVNLTKVAGEGIDLRVLRPFDESLGYAYQEDLPPAAIFYNLKRGSVAELNRAIELQRRNHTFNTPFLIFGKKREQEAVMTPRMLASYRYLDFFTDVTAGAMQRKLGRIDSRWNSEVALIDSITKWAWAQVLSIQERDSHTAAHSGFTAAFACLLGEKYGLSPLEILFLKLGCLMHDLGKAGVSIAILRGSHSLGQKGKEAIRQHPDKGVEVISPLIERFGWRLAYEILQIVKYHHCCFDPNDNRSYPPIDIGVERSYLTYFASLADSLEAATTSNEWRRYVKKDRTWDEIREDFEAQSGTQFNPDILPFLVDMINEGIAVEFDMPVPSTDIPQFVNLA